MDRDESAPKKKRETVPRHKDPEGLQGVDREIKAIPRIIKAEGRQRIDQ